MPKKSPIVVDRDNWEHEANRLRAVNAKLLEALEADVKWFVKQWELYMNCGQRGAAQEVSLLLDDAREAIEEARK